MVRERQVLTQKCTECKYFASALPNEIVTFTSRGRGRGRGWGRGRGRSRGDMDMSMHGMPWHGHGHGHAAEVIGKRSDFCLGHRHC